jgi:hypothetical protein
VAGQATNASLFSRPQGAFGDSLLPLLKTAQCTGLSRVQLKAAASCRTPKASPPKSYAALDVDTPYGLNHSEFPDLLIESIGLLNLTLNLVLR